MPETRNELTLQISIDLLNRQDLNLILIHEQSCKLTKKSLKITKNHENHVNSRRD